MDDVGLILYVQQYEELYNLQHPLYNNHQRRDAIWVEIAERMNETVSLCKERWTRIRENYRKALSLRKNKTGQAASKIKPPKYNQELSFLIPYLNDEELANMTIPSREVIQELSPPHVLYLDSPGDDSRNSESPLPSALPAHSYNSMKSRRSTDNSTLVATVLKELAKNNGVPQTLTQNHNNINEDPLIDFFISMARTVQQFDKKRQLYIKGKVFQLVHNAELEILKEDDAF